MIERSWAPPEVAVPSDPVTALDTGPTTTEPTTRGRGRPRSTKADEAIRHAVVELLAEHGYHGLRVDEVAGRSGVSKTTIYRRYPAKAALVVGVLAAIKSEQIPITESGDVADDLRTIIVRQYESLNGTAMARALPGLLAEKVAEPELAIAIEELWSSRQAMVAGVIERGVETGVIRSDLDVAHLLDLLAAPAYYRLLVTGREVDREAAEHHAEILLRLILVS